MTPTPKQSRPNSGDTGNKPLARDKIAEWIKTSGTQEHADKLEEASRLSKEAAELKSRGIQALEAYDEEVELVDQELDSINDRLHELGENTELEKDAEFLLDLVQSFVFFNQLERQLDTNLDKAKELNAEHNNLADSSNALFLELVELATVEQKAGDAQ